MKPSPIVTLTTDFGEGSRYVAAMKGVLLSINPATCIVDVTHSVPPQDVTQGAIALAEALPFFPSGAIHIAVVDPGVGAARRILYAKLDEHHFVLPDNGLLTCLAERAKGVTMRVVENRNWWLPEVSNTFHGRDIMAPVAARLSLGSNPAEVGPECTDYVKIPLHKAERVAGKLAGEVIEIDSFGNLITNITADMLADTPRGEGTRVLCDGHETMGIFAAYAEQPPMTLVALVGSGNKLELAIVDDSAKIMLGVGVGTPVAVQW